MWTETTRAAAIVAILPVLTARWLPGSPAVISGRGLPLRSESYLMSCSKNKPNPSLSVNRLGTTHQRDQCLRRLPFAHPFDPLSAPRAGLERIRKVLCFPRNLVAAELHDAHGVGRLPVIRQNILGDPKITAANDSPHSEALFARLIGARDLYVAPTADSLA